MKTNEWCIATISLARSVDEEMVLRAALQRLAALNIPVYITDGGSSERFIEFLQTFPSFVVLKAKGLWPQAKKSIMEAGKSNAKFIFYTEPDKLDFFSNHLIRMVEETAIEETAGVILASRSASSFSTFPLFQQMTETTINNCCKEVIGKGMDYCYGPFLFNTKLIPFLKTLDEDCGWGWRPFLFEVAHRIGLKVENYVSEFNCPSQQRDDDKAERLYRMKQLTQNVNGLLKAATIQLEEDK